MTHARGDGVYTVCLQAVLQQQFSTKYIDELLQEPASHSGNPVDQTSSTDRPD